MKIKYAWKNKKANTEQNTYLTNKYSSEDGEDPLYCQLKDC